ncbi:MAG: ABC transporter ATP-binding protein [Deltaproteobacteria bacterium]|nr:ABC transporter ATP-binding protein [Deltaproteobacteria bacterium]MBW2593262.1 ABC transporter ATP-binding protein [Deltaproteobacteria bacterium]
MLRLENLSCGYGPMRAVHELNLEVEKGRIHALLGANGAGKSSTIMCVAGHVETHGGRVIYKDEDITNIPPTQRVRAGIGLVPEGRRLFSELSVRENLIIGGYCRDKKDTTPGIDRVLETFPRLGERIHQQAGSLSGGEQQMLSIGRALMSRPRLLLIDELSLGLMPKAIDICYSVINDLKMHGMTIVLVEQSTSRALKVADSVTVLESGKMVWQGTPDEARASSEMIDACLGLTRTVSKKSV